jgi:Na+/H+ antiporter NhaD/arsenite permease-like protein
MSKDKILILSFIIVSILTASNLINKIFFDIEPVQYTFFSYDKILHLLASILIVRVLYWLFKQKASNSTLTTNESNNPATNSQKKLVIKASLMTLLLYALIWEPLELFTFIIQQSSQEQIYQEFFDIPLDWVYDIAGIITSYVLGYD